MYQGTNRNLPAGNTLAELLVLQAFIDQRATVHSVTDRQTYRRTDGPHDDANSRSYCVAARLAKN